MGLTEALRAACEAHATLLDEPTLPEVVDILLTGPRSSSRPWSCRPTLSPTRSGRWRLH
jgi:hypothetical protein